MGQTIVLDQAPVFPLVADNHVIFAIVLEFGSVYGFSVPEIPFTFCLNDVFGYVHTNDSIDASGSESIQFRCAVHNADFVPKESRSACLGMRHQRFFC
jgi:hypothetical protein